MVMLTKKTLPALALIAAVTLSACAAAPRSGSYSPPAAPATPAAPAAPAAPAPIEAPRSDEATRSHPAPAAPGTATAHHLAGP